MSGKRDISHDQLFKMLLKEFFIEFLEAFVPDVHRLVEPGSIEFLDKELSAAWRKRRKTRYADLVVKARVKGKPYLFIVHVEHQAKHDPDIGPRMFVYAAWLLQEYRLPVVPILLLSYQKPRDIKEPNHYSMTLEGAEILRLNYHVVQLNRLDWRRYLKNPNPAAAALMARMPIAPEDRVRVKIEISRMIATMRLDRRKMEKISAFVETYLQLTAREDAEFRRTAKNENIEEPTMKLMLMGERKGLKEGRREGRCEGAREGIVDVLEARFHRVPYGVKEQLEQVKGMAKLKRLMRAAVTTPSLDDFTRSL